MVPLTPVLLSLTTLLGVIVFAILRLSQAFLSTNIPGPIGRRRWPIVGDALWFWRAKTARDVYEIVRRLASSQQKLVSMYFGPKLIIAVLDAKIFEAIISSNKCPAKEEWAYHPFNTFSNGVFSKNGRGWSDLRRPLDRLLHTKQMDDFHRIFTDKAKTLCVKVGNKCNKGVFDMKHLMDFSMLDITLESLLKSPGTQQIDDSTNLPDLTTRVLDMIFRRLMKAEHRIDWIYYFSSLRTLDMELRKKVSPPLKEIVDNCRITLESEGRDPANPDFVPENYLEIAIQHGIKEQKSEEELALSFYDLIIAGFDTTSVATSSAVLFLAMHPECQEKAYQEQMEVMGDSLDAPSKEELSRMKYLGMVFNETLRRVSVPTIARHVSEEFVVDGYILPKGAGVAFMLHELFNDARYWEKPDSFFPDHFLPETVASRPKGAFVTFGFGGRACPGKLFGTQSSKLILSMLLRRYKFTTDLKFEEMVYMYMIMVESEKGYPVEVTARPNLKEVNRSLSYRC